MPSLTLPSRPTTVVAFKMEFTAASSTASTVARNSGERASLVTVVPRRVSVSVSGGKVWSVEKAIKKSPDPLLQNPIRASPKTARFATRISPL